MMANQLKLLTCFDKYLLLKYDDYFSE